MNEYDSKRILDLTKKINFIATENIEEADYILNTCHIRKKPQIKFITIWEVKKNLKIKPIVFVAGCVAQAEENFNKKEKYIDAIIGHNHITKLTILF